MKDNDIIKALKCCNLESDCKDCPLDNFDGTCSAEMLKQTLDLINRLQADNEKLQGYNENLQTANTALSNEILEAKAEAIKEFAERLTTKIVNTPFGVNCTGETDSYKEGCLHGLVAKQNNVIDMIDNLVKEMAGEG